MEMVGFFCKTCGLFLFKHLDLVVRRCGSLTHEIAKKIAGHEAAIGKDGDEPTKTHEGKDETHLDVDPLLVF